MPRKNIVKNFAADQFYHIYSRGVNKQGIFLDNEDFVIFLGKVKNYLSPKKNFGSNRKLLPTYFGRIELVAYCLMGNHFHLLVYLKDEKAMTDFMRSLMTSYSMYFNRKYKRIGPVFQSTYKASLIDRQNYLEHISRYIHLNPKKWQEYEFSSLKYYLSNNPPMWLTVGIVLELFENSPDKYLEFLQDYDQHKQMLEEMKWELANEIEE